MAIVVVIAIPRLNKGALAKLKLTNESLRLQADLYLTRRKAISENTNYVLKISSGTHSYQIYKSLNTVPYHTQRTIDSDISLSGDCQFEFQSFGNLAIGSSNTVDLSMAGYTATLTLTPETGRVDIVGP